MVLGAQVYLSRDERVLICFPVAMFLVRGQFVSFPYVARPSLPEAWGLAKWLSRMVEVGEFGKWRVCGMIGDNRQFVFGGAIFLSFFILLDH